MRIKYQTTVPNSLNSSLEENITSISSGFDGGYQKIGNIVVVNAITKDKLNSYNAEALITNLMPIPLVDDSPLVYLYNFSTDTFYKCRVRSNGHLQVVTAIPSGNYVIAASYIAK